MAGYVYIANSSKPKKEARASRERVVPSNVSRPCLKAALECGFDVYYGINRDNPETLECELPVTMYDAHTYRSLTAFKDNRTAYKNLSAVMRKGDIVAMHCNTPIGGTIGRICAKKFKLKKVIYTAHGFHFYKGAPLFYRTVLKWAEMIMARWTDAIITMNKEDFEAASRFKLRDGGKVYFVHGVGITLSDFDNVEVDREEKRKELGLKEGELALISAGDLIVRKNYTVAIKALYESKMDNLHYYICGKGPEEENLRALVSQLGLEDRVHFLGFRKDIKELFAAADVFLFTTLQEGLPRSMMEAMASGLPCIASAIRGNVDLMENGTGGLFCKSTDASGFADAIKTVCSDKDLRDKMSAYNLEKIREFDISVVEKEMSDIYKEVFKDL